MRFYLFLATFFVAAILSPEVSAADKEALSKALFDRYVGSTVQIRVLERVSNTKSAIGSGFVISSDGKIVTNYHVISALVFEPERYQIDAIDREGKSHPARVEYFDIIHDVALIVSDVSPAGIIAPKCKPLNQGEHLFSFGNPEDLGTSVVEGIYNGVVEGSLFARLHFTGSINPGMSGGPTLTGDGLLAGVNVASAGEQMSFLIPCNHVTEMSI